jgi:hypothetical protein
MVRYLAMKESGHPRKSVTHEPIMDFDVDTMVKWDVEIKPEVVWVGYDSHGCGLPEPPVEKFDLLVEKLKEAGLRVIKKRDRPTKIS